VHGVQLISGRFVRNDPVQSALWTWKLQRRSRLQTESTESRHEGDIEGFVFAIIWDIEECIETANSHRRRTVAARRGCAVDASCEPTGDVTRRSNAYP